MIPKDSEITNFNEEDLKNNSEEVFEFILTTSHSILYRMRRDGKYFVVKQTGLKYIPANRAYITVSADAPDELKVYTQAEYDALPDDTLRGDLNGDGTVDGLDYVMVVNMILENRNVAEADLNGDGIVNGLDLVILANIILTESK